MSEPIDLDCEEQGLAPVVPPATVEAELQVQYAHLKLREQGLVQALHARLDKEQKAALHGILVIGKHVTMINGPGGTGKSDLLKIAVLVLKGKVGILTPTQGARRADQKTVDGVLPRKSFKPELEVKTTYTGFGVGFKDKWKVESVIDPIRRKVASKAKAADTYTKEVLVVDEAAQTPCVQLDTAEAVGARLNGVARRWVLLMDGVQTPPVGASEQMIWESELVRAAEAEGELAVYTLERVYRTNDADLLALGAALRNEEYDEVIGLMQTYETTVADDSFVDIVHDNAETYEIARAKHGQKPGVQTVHARCDAGGPDGDVGAWAPELLRRVREVTKLPLEMHVYPGQQLLYEPIGSAGARTDGGWYLGKGELMAAVGYSTETKQLRVRCPNLNGALAWVSEEAANVDLTEASDGEYGVVTLRGPPWRYADILTVYSGQGSQFKNVHVHLGRFKGRRNLVYTAVTRAMEKLKISGIALDDGGCDVRDKCELHPKSVLWQARLGAGSFSAARLAQARLEVGQEEERVGSRRA